MLTPWLDEFIRRMPKVELHLHLEGSFAPRTLLELAQRNRVSIPARDEQELLRLLNYRDFGQFLAVFMELARAIVTGDDFERLAYELGADLARQKVRYAEVMLSPMQHLKRGVDLYEALAGTAAGFARAQYEHGVLVGIVLDLGRQYGPEAAWQVLETAQRAAPLGVVGWSIGGNEIGYPPEPFAEVFAAAKQAGFGLMAHAGEVAGPESVWGAIDALGVTRIGHGIRSVDDPLLLVALRERSITLDVCPSSNLSTGAVASWEEHPFPKLLAAGVPLTINSDDPTFFATSLNEELRHGVRKFGLGPDDLCQLMLNAARAAFLPITLRENLVQSLEAELTALRSDFQ